MFVIRPVEDKGVQEALCAACACPYVAEDFAYFAADLNEDGTQITGILGVCQFTLREGYGLVHQLVPFPGTFDEEVMTIMIRTAMEFTHRCGCGAMVLEEGACDTAFAEKIGFRKGDGDTRYRIDLVTFYKSPCGYQAKLEKEQHGQ